MRAREVFRSASDHLKLHPLQNIVSGAPSGTGAALLLAQFVRSMRFGLSRTIQPRGGAALLLFAMMQARVTTEAVIKGSRRTVGDPEAENSV